MQNLDPRVLNALEWRLIGPHRGGRVVAVAGDPVHPMTFYFGACAGGVWKTTDGGWNWQNVSDGFFKTAAVGAIAVSQSDPNVIYVGTGETTIRGNVSHGDGVYKSTNAGKTWTNVGLSDTRHIAKIRIHPHNPDWMYVAALGHAWGPNPERGVYRSQDGGKTWQHILFRSEKAGAIDLAMDPHNPRILYAAMWQAQRYPYQLVSGGPDSGLFKSTDGGESWTELTNNPGLPKGIKGKIGVAISPAKTDRVWALVEAEDGALFRSEDGGATWERLCDSGDLRRRAWYYTHVYADPQDAETVWVLNVQCWKSVDGGRTFNDVPVPHGDNHDLWIDPNNPQRMIEGNDGGACISFNASGSWSTLYNQPTAQFYHVIADNQIPYRVYGSQQDNSAISLPSMSMRAAITSSESFEPGGGESGYIAIKPDNPNIIVGGAIGSGYGNGRLIHYNHITGQERNITVWPEVLGMAHGAKELKYRFQWTFPILFSRHDPNVLYVTANHVLRSTDEGHSWQELSPDLTRNDPTRLEPSGGPITYDNTGAEVYCTIFAFAESPHDPNVLWAGSDDGLIHISQDGGATWQNITPQALPEWALISIIEPSPHDPATAYVAATRYKHDDTQPYLYKTNDYGKTWQLITNGISNDDFTRVIREDPERRGLLYAGTETGVYVSFDEGTNWHRFQNNLPIVPIYDLVVKDSDLIAATHGRSFWILDDVTPLRQLTDEIAQAPVHLFQPRPTTRFKIYPGYGGPAGKGLSYRAAGVVVFTYREEKPPLGQKRERFLDAGQNPPDGVILIYTLKDKPEEEITLSILDVQGKAIKTFTSKSVDDKDEKAKEQALASPSTQHAALSPSIGSQRFVWNMRYPDALKVPGDKSLEDLGVGPLAPPGTYQAQLKVGDKTYTQTFEIVKDPRVNVTQADLETQFNLLIKVRDRLSEVHETVLRVRDLRAQAEGWATRLKDQPHAQAVVEAAEALKKELNAIEEELIQAKASEPRGVPSRLNFRLAALAGFADSADTAPTQQTQAVFEDLSGRIARQLERLEMLITRDVAAFNELAQKAAIGAMATPQPRK